MAYRKIGRETRQRHSVFAGQAAEVIIHESIITTEIGRASCRERV